MYLTSSAPQVVKRLITLAVVLSVIILFSPIAMADKSWERYRQQFISGDGRVIDTTNEGISHSEGQGFGMLFAAAFDDRETFESLWSWTRSNLSNPDNHLFYWKYNPTLTYKIEDRNNASDGDVLIAWALLKAGKQWDEPNYLEASDEILWSILEHNIIQYADYTVMLPGVFGFISDEGIVLNPSYFIYPAWQDFAARVYVNNLHVLITDTLNLMLRIDWGDHKIATDWIVLYPDGSTAPAADWPARVSYDAFRIPVYVKWRMANHPLLERWSDMLSRTARLQTPAWENVFGHSRADYPMSGGLLAIRDFTVGELEETSTLVSRYDDYYSASLKLLVSLAAQGY
ncbi:endoglucanase [Photobacterium sp. BZF1]|nr:endoglucanase [Photobacterium sp. BZF1]